MRYWLLLVVPIIVLTVWLPRVAYVFGGNQFRSSSPHSFLLGEHCQQPAWLREEDDDGFLPPEGRKPDRRFRPHC